MATSSEKMRQSLKKRLDELVKDYEAVQERLGVVLDPIEKRRLESQADNLESEINEIEAKLHDFPGGGAHQEAETSPFKGLESFTVADAHLFFGRSKLTAELLKHLENNNFLAVVGASGSGKSSVVRAGLIPKLKSGQTEEYNFSVPEGSSHWPIHIIRPGINPLDALAISLTRETPATGETEKLSREMGNNARSLHIFARKVLPEESNGRLLIVIDQFEELFTRCRDGIERKAFVDNLTTAVDPATVGSTIIVLIIRSDFVHRCEIYPELYRLIRNREILVSRMSNDELREAIEQPADLSDLEFSPGLVEHILKDLSNVSAPLPLLSHALLETWQRRRGNTLTFQGYFESGGVQGAIAKTADRVYDKHLNPEQQIISWNIFSRLIELGESTSETRRRATFDEFASNLRQAKSIHKVLEILAKHRLITTSDTTVELSHEALIENWPKLRQWLDNNRDGLIIRNRFSEVAAEWHKRDKHEDFLVVGRQVEIFEEWHISTQLEINDIEHEFLEASRKKTQQLITKKLREKRVKQLTAGLVSLTLLIMIFFALFRLPPFNPTWAWANGPIGGDTWMPGINPATPNEIYIGYARQGVYKSQDGGYNWFPANTGLANRLVGNLTIDPDTNIIFAVADSTTIYQSIDGGNNWFSINRELPSDIIIRDMILYTGDLSTDLYIATWQYGIWSTPIDEINWQQKTRLGLESSSIHQIKITNDSPPVAYASASHQGLFRSYDLGITWEHIAFPQGDITQIDITPWNTKVIYAYDATSGPYISQDKGITWLAIADQITERPRSMPYFSREGQTNAIFVGTYDGQVFRSNENGTSWQSVWDNLPLAIIRNIRILPVTNNILLSTSNGVYLSSDGGNSWELRGPEVLPVRDIISLPNGSDRHILAATNSGIHHSQAGEVWETLNGGLGELEIDRLTISEHSYSPEVYAISDRGKLYNLLADRNIWQLIALPENIKATSIAIGVIESPITLVTNEENHVYQSYDKVHWRYLWQAPGRVADIITAPGLPETFYLATLGNGVFHSSDGGETWSPANNGLTNPTVNALVASAQNSQLLYAATNNGVFVSQNGGQSWNHSVIGLTTRLITSVAIHPQFDGMVYAGTPGGIFVSYNYGQTWRTFDKGLESNDITSISVDSQFIYVGTNRGIYYMKHPVIPTLFWK